MEHHIHCKPEEISRYVFCPGDQARARKIAERFEDCRLVFEGRGYIVFTGSYEGTRMTALGTGMGGPAVAIALEEMAHLGADTFIRVGSCGVFQPGQMPGDVIIASGTFRAGGTGNHYLPPAFPAVPNFAVLRALVEAAEELGVPPTVGVALASDAFYTPLDPALRAQLVQAGTVAIEMESDTLFIVGAYRGWRTGAVFTSDGTAEEMKPAWGEERYRQGEVQSIRVALRAMKRLADRDAR